ncbi:hypothetical protein [Thermophagus xiamenensis]|uniref:Uncharacterized protein n=1 Tax=Thermophagus xiamenensis TaxID=385682 RepID=A0A1I2ETY7_9BACT|nr:hypothetical protein [Thermophagus xiamenensis]SFE96305.1 hypothetical protein SAMN05444380_12442 [Thermophagus xiamenensis]
MTFKFFLTPFYIPDNYSPEAIALAEGLEQLGHSVFSNIDYWFVPEENRYLFNKNENDDYDVGIYDYKYLYHSKKWTLNRIDASKVNILLDRNDWIIPEWNNKMVLRKFDFILADHLLENVKYPSNVLPWAIGYTKRIERYIDRFRNTHPPIEEIVYNFRVAHNLRGRLVKSFLDNDFHYPVKQRLTDSLKDKQTAVNKSKIDHIYWEQTAKRHNPEFYKLLDKSLLTLSFGGYLEVKPFFYQPYNLIQKLIRKPIFIISSLCQKFNIDNSKLLFVFQYDSFRMWETFYANTCPILLDMDYWKFKLPAKPIEGKHYIGIRNLTLKDFKKRLNSLNTNQIREIGINGSIWVKENYSPEAVANRLLKLINK